MDKDLPEPVPAATLVLMREEAGGPPELLFTERNSDMAFAAGALVFPGGRVDPEDHEAARAFQDVPDAAARIAAIRETIEETGIAVALSPYPDESAARRIRDGIDASQDFSSLLAREGLALRLDALTPFARWCPNFRETRRFDTLFFIAEVDPRAPAPKVDTREAARAFWASAGDVLAEIAAGRAHAIFPTRRNLERLARFGSIAEARADAVLHPVRRITPWVEQKDGRAFVCIPDDAGYPVTSEPLETARRR